MKVRVIKMWLFMNHPPQIIIQLPKTSEEQLSKILLKEAIFKSYKAENESTLKESGFKTNLKYI